MHKAFMSWQTVYGELRARACIYIYIYIYIYVSISDVVTVSV